VPIRFTEAIPIAVVGLLVNIASAWLLSGGDHDHIHGHGHGHGHGHATDEHAAHDHDDDDHDHTHGTDTRDHDHDHDHDHAHDVDARKQDHAQDVDTRDHNIRAAYIHVIADAAVSVLAIIGLLLAKTFGWLWMDPLAGIVGALVIANWSYGLMRDTAAILLDVSPSDALEKRIMTAVEKAGDELVDLHVWRLGPGHFGAVVSVVTNVAQRAPSYYHSILRNFTGLSHITVEVHPRLGVGLD
jgi:cation diffusion facilitator family transporter